MYIHVGINIYQTFFISITSFTDFCFCFCFCFCFSNKNKKCGLLCTKQLAAQNLHVRAVTRTARSVLEETSDYVTYASGDVTDLASITNAVKDASGVIFAASASKKGGDAAHVDYLGVANTAKACIANQVPKLAIISSLAVTRPQSIGFKITNIFGRIMVCLFFSILFVCVCVCIIGIELLIFYVYIYVCTCMFIGLFLVCFVLF